jgi:squalene cyclase
LKNRQLADGHWWVLAHRPPMESNDIEVTAASLRALQLYAPAAQRPEYDAAIRRAAVWLRAAEAKTTEERAFKVLGLAWGKADGGEIQAAAKGLLAQQRADGGWSQLPTLTSDAYATGEALVALRVSGTASATDPSVTRGIRFLMRTQLEDGSWLVRSRSVPLQPYFESGFPHGRDQWISAAATNWAATALALSAPPR